MTVFPANNTHELVHYWQGRYGGLGHLYGPSRTERPRPHLPYALDNGAFGAFVNGTEWDEARFMAHVGRYAFASLPPEWVVVPDVVADREATLDRWEGYAGTLSREYGLTLAVAVQDGMTAADVRALVPAAAVVFVGGSTDWKWATLRDWCAEFPRVHVGRVNTEGQLARASEAGAESCDGTGWFRGHEKQIAQLGRFLAIQAGRYDQDEEREILRVVHHSRTKRDKQGCLPMDGGE